MKKFKFFLNYEKEESWLEHMARQGYKLKSAGYAYTFDYAPCEQVNIKIDYRVFKREQDFLDYCSLFEDSGWRHISGTKNSGTQYFKKIQTDGNEDIFSDATSRAGRYKRLSEMWQSFAITFLPFLVLILRSDGFNMNGFINPKALYLTPGLWEMSGFDFWWSFLFETPFVILRGYSTFIWLLLVLLSAFFSIKSWSMYKKASSLGS